MSLTWLRSKRFSCLDKKISKTFNQIPLKEIYCHLSFVRLINFIFPFKIGDLISLFYLKKKIINQLNISVSYILITKFFEFFLLILISFIVCIVFFIETKINFDEKILFKYIYFLILIIFFLLFFYIKRKKVHLNKIVFKKNFLNNFKILIISKNFLSYSFFISFIQFLCTVLIIFLSSDRSIDNELFFLTSIYVLLNAIPIKLPFGISSFDFFSIALTYYFDYGLSIQNLTTMRSIQFLTFSIDYILWYSLNKIRNIN